MGWTHHLGCYEKGWETSTEINTLRRVDRTRLGAAGLSMAPAPLFFLTTRPGWSQFCLEQPCWFAYNFVLFDQLWIGPNPGDSLSRKKKKEKNPFSVDSRVLRVWCADFFSRDASSW